MAINPTRQQIRLNKTKTEGASITSEINQTQVRLELIDKHLSEFQAQVISLDEQIAAQVDIQVKSGINSSDTDEQGRLKIEAFKSSMEALTKLTEEKGTVVTAYETESKTANELTVRLEALNRHPILTTLALQQAALDRAEEAYPSLLKRHLRKCKRFGWSDGRLAALKGGK
jgi:septal ring factor EnvC (AmiA/AmiB activator)